MAEMLRDADSSTRHLNVVYRHMRLCKRMKGAEFLVTQITPPYAALGSAQTATEQALLDKDSASDDFQFQGIQGADHIRSLFSKAEDYDRKHVGERVLPNIFPELAFGSYLESNGTVTASTLRIFVARISALGNAHPLSPLAAELEAQAVLIDGAEGAFNTATTAHQIKVAEEEVAQANVRKAYEVNYLDARKTVGKVLAERLFPKFRRKGNGDASKGDDESAEPAAGMP